MDEEENAVASENQKYGSCWQVMKSTEIVEIGDDSKSIVSSRDGGVSDVYIAVGRDDLSVVKWAIDHHAVSPATRFFLVHVFPPTSYISTPVGRLSKSQLSHEQLRFYINEENSKRRNLLQKYIRLCTDAKVTVDTMLLEANSIAKAILDLIPVLNITSLVMGTKRPPSSRWLIKGIGKGESVKKKAPDFCEVNIVYDGKKLVDGQHQQVAPSALPPGNQRPDITRQSARNFFECMCFSARTN